LNQTSFSCGNCKKEYGHAHKPVPWHKGSSSRHFCTREEVREEAHDILKGKNYDEKNMRRKLELSEDRMINGLI